MELVGENLILRLVNASDEDFIRFLTSNGSLHKHLTATADEMDDFDRWITDYKEKETSGTEYYFIIENFNGIRYGTVRINKVVADACELGSFLLLSQRPDNFSYESADVICQFVFEELALRKIKLEVFIRNMQAIRMFQILGFEEENRDEEKIYMTLEKEDFIKNKWRESHEGYYFSWGDWL